MQFELLASFCLVAQEIVSDALDEIDRAKLITTQLLDETNVKSEVTTNVEHIQMMAPIQLVSILNLLQVLYPTNGLVSALGTNTYVTFMNPAPYMYSTIYWNGSESRFDRSCLDAVSLAPAAFYREEDETNIYRRVYWPYDPFGNVTHDIYEPVDGFYGACLPLDAVLASTLDCLYDSSCLQIWRSYFPNLNQVSRLQMPRTTDAPGITVQEYIAKLFVEEWSTKVNYTNYFHACAPQQCTYSVTDRTNFSYALVTLLSLYGGLTAILRLFSASLISLVSTMTRPNRDIIGSWTKVKRLNLFKSSARRKPLDIRQQRVTTLSFLILFGGQPDAEFDMDDFHLLSGSVVYFLLFNALRYKTITVTVDKPSVHAYRDLYSFHPDSLRCPCEQSVMAYEKFVSLAPIFHPVCSSDLVSEEWIAILVRIRFSDSSNQAWMNEASRYFRYLSALCQLANRTINEGVRRFVARTIATADVLSEVELNAQLNSTVKRLINSFLDGFHLFMDMSNSLLQVDQPLIQLYYGSIYNYNGLHYGTNDQEQQSPHVCLSSFEMLEVVFDLGPLYIELYLQ